jgi:hypothetical protein
MELVVTSLVGLGASWLGWFIQPFDDPVDFSKQEFINNVLICQKANLRSKFSTGCYIISDVCCLKFMKDYILRLDRVLNSAKDKICTNESIVKVMTKIKCDLLDYFCKNDISTVIIDLKNWFQHNWSLDASILKTDIVVRLANWIWDLKDGVMNFIRNRSKSLINQLVLLMSLFLDVLSMASTNIYNNFINSLKGKHGE